MKIKIILIFCYILSFSVYSMERSGSTDIINKLGYPYSYNSSYNLFLPLKYRHLPLKEQIEIALNNKQKDPIISAPSLCDEPKNQGTTTAAFRYPHLLRYLHTGVERLSVENILVLGPGLQKGTYPSIPQLHELAALFSNSHFTVVDNDQSVIKAIPFSRYYFEQAKTVLLHEANFAERYIEQSKYLLKNVLTHIPHTLPVERITTVLKDFSHSEFAADDSYDLIFATTCLAPVIDENWKNEIAQKIALHILKALKKGGILFLDEPSALFIREILKLNPKEFSIGDRQFTIKGFSAYSKEKSDIGIPKLYFYTIEKSISKISTNHIIFIERTK